MQFYKFRFFKSKINMTLNARICAENNVFKISQGLVNIGSHTFSLVLVSPQGIKHRNKPTPYLKTKPYFTLIASLAAQECNKCIFCASLYPLHRLYNLKNLFLC